MDGKKGKNIYSSSTSNKKEKKKQKKKVSGGAYSYKLFIT
jgi:hypothetical protein